MNYNTETINQIASAIAALMKTAVNEEKQSSGSNLTIAEIEMGMRQAIREIGEQALGMLLSSLQSTPALVDCKSCFDG